MFRPDHCFFVVWGDRPQQPSEAEAKPSTIAIFQSKTRKMPENLFLSDPRVLCGEWV